VATSIVEENGLSAAFGKVVHCLAAEPFATFVRIAVITNYQEVAVSTALLGRLRRGYRIFPMRSMLGTRIELCCVLVCITFGSEANSWVTVRQLRIQNAIVKSRTEAQRAQIEKQRQHIEMLEASRRTTIHGASI